MGDWSQQQVQHRVVALAPQGDSGKEVPKDLSLPWSRGQLLLGCLPCALQAGDEPSGVWLSCNVK